jgi:hypothetical protein
VIVDRYELQAKSTKDPGSVPRLNVSTPATQGRIVLKPINAPQNTSMQSSSWEGIHALQVANGKPIPNIKSSSKFQRIFQSNIFSNASGTANVGSS